MPSRNALPSWNAHRVLSRLLSSLIVYDARLPRP